MKRILSICFAIFLLTGCGSTVNQNSSSMPGDLDEILEQISESGSDSDSSPSSSSSSIEPGTSSSASSSTSGSQSSTANSSSSKPNDVVPTLVKQPVNGVNITELYSFSSVDRTYHKITGKDDIAGVTMVLAALKPQEGKSPDEQAGLVDGFLLVGEDNQKFTYSVSQDQVTQENLLYSTTEKQRGQMLQVVSTYNHNYSGIPQWLAYMGIHRITEINCSAYQGQFNTCDKNIIKSIAKILKEIKVVRGSTEKNMGMTNQNSTADSIFIKMTFDSNVTYTIVLESNLAVMCSDYDYTLTYHIEDSTQVSALREAISSGNDAVHEGRTGKAIDDERVNPLTGKPVIYLYPTQKQQVNVKLQFNGTLTYTYPKYPQNGWTVTAYPDGKLINALDQSEHYYLFWEGNSDTKWDLSEGFVVKGQDTQAFLIDKLSYMGLTPREYNDFIVYWLPEMINNPYNLISFSTEQYENLAPLTITPKPDSMLRIHMVYKSVDIPISIAEQKLTPFQREGFTVVEWGGSRA